MPKDRTITIPGCELAEIPLKDITEGERFREDYGDLTDLCHSIKTQGLINPIAVTIGPSSNYVLVAGGRRLRACQEIGMETIPVRIFTQALSELDLRILELAENIQRKDMTWQESNTLQREIHRLQQEKHGKATPGSGPITGWRIEDTATMLGVSKSQASESIRLAEKLEKFAPVLGDASQYKTENDARKAVKAVEEAMIRAELAKRAEKKANSDSFTRLLSQSYQVGDCLEGLKTYPDQSFDFAEVDPPYSIDLNEKKRDNSCENYEEVKDFDFLIFNRSILEQLYRVLKPNTFCLYWFGIDPWYKPLLDLTREVGFEGSAIPLIWTKPNGQSLSPNTSLANCYETALILKKGSPVLAKPGHSNVFSYQPVAAQKKWHPTQKPLELYTEIYETFSFEGSKCVTPFAGSGASILAAHMVKRFSVGWDLSKEFKGGYLQAVSELFLTQE